MKKFSCLLLAGAVSACATPYVPVPFDRQSSGVVSIAVMDDSMPETTTPFQAATMSANMAGAAAAAVPLAGIFVGLVAGGIQAGIESDRRNKLEEILKANNFFAETLFEERLQASLVEQGFSTSIHGKARKERDFLKVYPDNPADAHLDVVVHNYGYVTAGDNVPWRPYANISVRLIGKDKKTVLMDNRLAYNPLGSPEEIVNISANDAYSFESWDAVIADPQKAIAGLHDVIDQSAKTIGTLLK